MNKDIYILAYKVHEKIMESLPYNYENLIVDNFSEFEKGDDIIDYLLHLNTLFLNDILNERLMDSVQNYIRDIKKNIKFLINELRNKNTLSQVSENSCEWKHVDMGMFNCPDYVYKTSCGEEYDSDKISILNFCPNCGDPVCRYNNT